MEKASDIIISYADDYGYARRFEEQQRGKRDKNRHILDSSTNENLPEDSVVPITADEDPILPPAPK